MIPWFIGFDNLSTPRFAYAYCPIYAYFWSMPTIIEGILGLPTTVLNLDLGPSYPVIPTLQLPDPLSITMQTFPSIVISYNIFES